MTNDRDDALLDSIRRGEAPAAGDDLAVLLAAWHADVSDIDPAILRRPATVATRLPRLRFRIPRPLVVGLAAAVLAFGGLTAASAAAGPDSPFWPITRIVWGDAADSRLAEQEANRLLEQAGLAIAAGRHAEATNLLGAAREKIALITDAAARQRLETQAAMIEAMIATALRTTPSPVVVPTPSPAGNAPITPNKTPQPAESGLLPPLPSLLPTPTRLIPCLPLLCG